MLAADNTAQENLGLDITAELQKAITLLIVHGSQEMTLHVAQLGAQILVRGWRLWQERKKGARENDL